VILDRFRPARQRPGSLASAARRRNRRLEADRDRRRRCRNVDNCATSLS
jgi:hypothetical protein